VLFFKHIWWWFVIMLFCVLSLPILPLDGWFSVSNEVTLNQRFYGPETHRKVVEASQQRFNRWFVDTGAYGFTMDFTKPTPKTTKLAENEFKNLDVGSARVYVNQFWDGVLRAVYRWEINWHWYLIAVISLCVGVNEGICKRNIRPADALYVSPANFHLVGHFLVANVVGALLVLPWIPLVMTWWLWVIAIMLMTKFWGYAVMSMPSLKAKSLG
jgi:hypothetical protein